jgi:hypothetical protein
MACLSELLNVVYKRLPEDALGSVIDVPNGMTGQVAINPDYDSKAEEPKSDDLGSTDKSGGVQNSINDFPF